MVAEKQCYTQAKPLEAEFLRDWERNGTGIENKKGKKETKNLQVKKERRKKRKKRRKKRKEEGRGEKN